MSAPRMRTLPEAIKEIKSLDPDTALTLTALRRMVKNGELPYTAIASKRLISPFLPCLIHTTIFIVRFYLSL